MSLYIILDDSKLDVTTLSTARILELYNQLAFELGKPEVKRFSSRTTAESRIVGIADAARAAKKGKGLLNKVEVETKDGPVEVDLNKLAIDPSKHPGGIEEKPAPALKPSPTPKATAPAAAGSPRWARPKKEAAAKVAYRPKTGSIQEQMYQWLTQPGGIPIEEFCQRAKATGMRDRSFFVPQSVWSGLRYLFVTSKGYGLSFDGSHIQLLIPADEREANGKK